MLAAFLSLLPFLLVAAFDLPSSVRPSFRIPTSSSLPPSLPPILLRLRPPMDARAGHADGLCSSMHGGALGGGDGQEPRACLQGTSSIFFVSLVVRRGRWNGGMRVGSARRMPFSSFVCGAIH